jgi:hypothetical protein
MKEKMKIEDLVFICLVPTAINNTGKSKLIRRNSVKLRKPSLRIKDTGKSKNFLISLLSLSLYFNV